MLKTIFLMVGLVVPCMALAQQAPRPSAQMEISVTVLPRPVSATYAAGRTSIDAQAATVRASGATLKADADGHYHLENVTSDLVTVSIEY